MPVIKVNMTTYTLLVDQAMELGTSITDLASMIIQQYFGVEDVDEPFEEYEEEEEEEYEDEED
jgi:hypothetical protein